MELSKEVRFQKMFDDAIHDRLHHIARGDDDRAYFIDHENGERVLVGPLDWNFAFDVEDVAKKDLKKAYKMVEDYCKEYYGEVIRKYSDRAPEGEGQQPGSN